MIRSCIPLVFSPTTTVQIAVAREQRNTMPMPIAVVTNTHIFFSSEQTRAKELVQKYISIATCISIIFVIHLQNIHEMIIHYSDRHKRTSSFFTHTIKVHMGMGTPMKMEFAWESRVNGNSFWKWEWE